MEGLQVGILGPLEVLEAGRRVPLGGRRQRAVLARLALDAGRVVRAESLVEAVWDGAPPPSAGKTMQKYVSELRKALPRPVLRTEGRGYVLDIGDGEIDARRFETLVAAGEPRQALALWRGDVLADLADLSFVAVEAARLEEARLAAFGEALDAELRTGRPADSIGELVDLVAGHPLHERLTGLLMRALYGSGRQVEALRAYEELRARLAEEVGLEPSPELRRLEASILRQDLDLDAPRRVEPVRPGGAGSVPLTLTTFVGRDDEVEAIGAALAAHRLVTVSGPGGVGKTRLALEIGARSAGRFAGGVWFVDLSGVGSATLVANAVASVLAVDLRDGDDEVAALVAALAHRDGCLLVLDNCEHVADACASLVGALLRAHGDVQVLTTSRRPIGVDGECVRPLAPLADAAAVELFADRARLAGADLERDEDGLATAVAICRGLDGLPLAIELAASQLRVLDAQEIAERLHERLQFAGAVTSAPLRQRTLRDVVAWSHQLIPPATRSVYASLGVFASSLTLEAAEAVCGLPDMLGHVTTLVDHSLLARQAGRPPARYRLLETLRIYALERLAEAGGERQARQAHAAYYLQLAEQAGPRLHGPVEADWRARLEVEEPNLHAALSWTAVHDPETSLRLAIALWPYWDVRWSERHGIAHLQQLLEQPGLIVDERQRAWGLTAAAELAANPGDARRSVPWATEAVATFRRLGDEAGLARALFALGLALGNGSRLAEAEATLTEGTTIAGRLGDDLVVGRALNAVSYVATRLGQVERAAALNREEVALWRRMGSRRGEATALRHLAVAHQHLGDLEIAAALCQEALVIWEEEDDPASEAHVRLTIADVARLGGEPQAAAAEYERALAGFRSIGDRRCTASTFKNQALLADAAGDHAEAEGLLRRSVELRHTLGDDAGLAECLEAMGSPAWAVGDRRRAVALLAAACSLRQRTGAVGGGDTGPPAAALLDRARVDLGDDVVDQALAAAAERSVAEIVDLALGVAPS